MIDKWLILLLPFFGTVLGSSLIYLKKWNLNHSISFGFASGVMLAAAIFGLLIPSYESGGFVSLIIGLVAGVISILIIDLLFKDGKVDLLNLSVILHNIPEGLSVGVIIASQVPLGNALSLALGIAIQNIPEGFIISMNNNSNKVVSFIKGILSGIVEPIAGVIIYLLMINIEPVIPYFLSYAAGSMLYVVFVELLPKCKSISSWLAFIVGIVVMIVLEIFSV